MKVTKNLNLTSLPAYCKYSCWMTLENASQKALKAPRSPLNTLTKG